MSKKFRFGDGSTRDFPVVVAEDTAVLVQWDGINFRCSADAAHALSDSLFKAALEAESQRMALSGRTDD